MEQILKFDVVEAQEKFESLMAMAFNGETVVIDSGGDMVKIEPLPDSLIPDKVWTAEDFADWN